MKVAVLGASGTMGSLVREELSIRGHEVVGVSRGTGVDVMDRGALAEGLRGVEVVIDCLNVETLSGRCATDFFTRAVESLAAAVPDVRHAVVLSILNVDDSRVRRVMGYYAAKYAHEQAYRRAFPGRSTVVRTSQWFELGAVLRRQIRVGRYSLVPAMGTQPVAGRAAARLLADAAEQPPAEHLRELAGPERMTFTDVARAAPGDTKVVRIPLPFRWARTALLPSADVPCDRETLAQWRAR